MGRWAYPATSSRPCWSVFHASVAHLMRTGNFTTPCNASRSPSRTPASSSAAASTSMMGAAIKGKTVAEARQLIGAFKALMSIHESKLEGESDGADLQAELDGVTLGDLEALQGVVKFPVRIKCATLAWNTLQQGLDEVAG